MNTIRPAKLFDYPVIEAIVQDAIQHMRAHNIDQWDEIYPDREILETDIRQQEMYVTSRHGTICGFITINRQEAPEYSEVAWRNSGRVLVIHRLTVSPNCQSRGFATKLMHHAEAMAAKNGYDTIRLDAFANNPRALILYERLGYHRAGMVKFRKGRFYCYEKKVTAHRA
ncbi:MULTISPECIES: GNAT family N-acetyltransferase [Desulfosediminicola]|uniref:GNAT family N-acetyltransferase n=1 Tax=Desulfosediminicola TaxID=2886823 RepID=UPI0010ACC4A9|nr:GNAT family N-acetyltransferase [Desulfosediminicola ganghwensis]